MDEYEMKWVRVRYRISLEQISDLFSETWPRFFLKYW